MAKNKFVLCSLFFLSDSAQTCLCRVDKYVRGLYAITVKGRIPEDVEQDLDSQGIKYRPRDQTEVD